MNISKMRFWVESYYTNLTMLTELQNKIDYNVKVTANYNFEAVSSGGFSSSKTEDLALKNYCQRDKIKELENKVLTVDRAMKILDNKEREVIERVKIHRNRLSRIAKEIHKSSRYVFTTRNRAIKKMSEYIEEAEKDVKD